ncbi:hypothetical protein DSO57_1029007 [Entomophthora muscae]|uniref:Uncharacterized protein n=1 Tax=Entomophthora muscae TaxID=34485 RepID=A0ACC2UBM4_9FUNG|nr:hypothetical protein DSO57_1029007 [Entomophthora muscae]
MFEDITAHAQDIYTISENVVRSLTCNVLEFPAIKAASTVPPSLAYPTPVMEITGYYEAVSK